MISEIAVDDLAASARQLEEVSWTAIQNRFIYISISMIESGNIYNIIYILLLDRS